MNSTYFKAFDSTQCDKFTNPRKGEKKFGEKIDFPDHRPIEIFLEETSAKYILLGIEEDIGVQANLGRGGTRMAWENTLKSLLNIQHNKYCKGNWVGVLGSFSFDNLLSDATTSQPKDLYHLVEIIDKEVTHLLHIIHKYNKIPIVIGGGHNNAYGSIKALALHSGTAVNAINFDAHTDFRAREGRHSGNGFSYAYEEKFLDKYFIFGLHENYTSKSIFQEISDTNGNVAYNTFEEIAIREEKTFITQLNIAYQHIKDKKYGIEMDLDSIEMMPSSAITPTGFTSTDARRFIHHLGLSPKAAYLHICEGAPNFGSDKNPNLIGKLISYMVTDFIKAKEQLSV
ncbi:MAG TPA: formimidoylglutamase [Flavobacterium sp.]|nr:formimidoylglutamase [Flavobacterium sp.]